MHLSEHTLIAKQGLDHVCISSYRHRWAGNINTEIQACVFPTWGHIFAVFLPRVMTSKSESKGNMVSVSFTFLVLNQGWTLPQKLQAISITSC